MTARARRERTGLDRLVGTDLANFRTSRRLFRENGLYELPERVTGVYTALRESVERAKANPRQVDDDVTFAMLFLMRSAYAFERGLVEVMQVHLSDSFGHLRSALEAAGFADLVRRDRSLAGTWLDAANDEARYDLYRKKFRTNRMFPEADPPMRQIRLMYDWASRMASHGSVYSFSTRLDVVREGAGVRFNYRYHDVRRPEDVPRDVLAIFMVHINTHLAVLQVFARALKDVIEKAVWDLHFNTAEVLFEGHRDRLAPILAPGTAAPGGLAIPPPLMVLVRAPIWTPGGRPR